MSSAGQLGWAFGAVLGGLALESGGYVGIARLGVLKAKIAVLAIGHFVWSANGMRLA
ncbi:MAG: hypothetical protein HY329_04050 [Chloroflexi bacterium]|nr:hypothetical protein [Chloroflexota bacterium]